VPSVQIRTGLTRPSAPLHLHQIRLGLLVHQQNPGIPADLHRPNRRPRAALPSLQLHLHLSDAQQPRAVHNRAAARLKHRLLTFYNSSLIVYL